MGGCRQSWLTGWSCGIFTGWKFKIIQNGQFILIVIVHRDQKNLNDTKKIVYIFVEETGLEDNDCLVKKNS